MNKTCMVLSFLFLVSVLFGQAKDRQFATVTIKGVNVADAEIIVYKYGIGLYRVQANTYSIEKKQERLLFNIPEGGSREHMDVEIRLNIVGSDAKPSAIDNSVFILSVFKGDKINCSISSEGVVFHGKDSAFFSLQRVVAKLAHARDIVWDYSNPDHQFRLYDSTWRQQERLIKASIGAVSKRKLDLIRTETLLSDHLSLMTFFSLAQGRSNKEELVRSYLATKTSSYSLFNAESRLTKLGLLQKSSLYPVFVLNRFKYDSCIVLGKPAMDDERRFEYIKKAFCCSTLSDILIYLITDNRASSNISGIITYAQKVVKGNTDYEEIIQRQSLRLMTGRRFYEFALPDANGKTITLEAFKGKTVLVDFWYTGCGNCREIHPVLDSLRATLPKDRFALVTVSIDRDKEIWLKSIANGLYTSENNINVFTEGKGSEHPLITYYHLQTYPNLFLIDRNGNLADPPPDPRADRGATLVSAINKVMNGHN